MNEKSPKQDASTRTVERAITLLAYVCDAGPVSLADSARAAELAPSTALRLLRTLEQSGFVSRTDDGTYRAGSRIIQLGAQALSAETLPRYCRAEMVDLVAATGESAYLSVPGHDGSAVYIAIVEGTHSVRHVSWVGRTIPLEGSAAGAALTGRVGPAGYAVQERGVEPDITAIAAPIRTSSAVVAALSLVIPSYRVTQPILDVHGRHLAEAAGRLSAGLSSTAPSPPPKENR